LADEFLQTSRPLAMAQLVSTYIGENEDGPSPYDSSHTEPVLLLNGFQAPEGVGRPGSWPQAPDFHWPGRNGYPLGAWGFYQPKFEEILRRGLKRFSSVTTRLSTCCIRISQRHEHAVASLQQVQGSWLPTPGNEVTFASEPRGEAYTVRSKFVIGCDGARSAVRKAMGGEGMVSLDYDERWWACDVKLLKPEGEVWGTKLPHFSQLIADPRRAYTVVPLWQVTDHPPVGRHVRFDIQVSASDKEEEMLSPDKIRRLISPWLDPGDYELVRFAVYRFWSLVAQTWRQGRLFLAGDACHTMPPFLGQGMNQGLKDVTNLCWKILAVLRGSADGERLLDTYEEERRPLLQAVVEGSLKVGRMMESMKEASAKSRAALELEVKRGRGQGLEGGLPLAASRIEQRTGPRRYPPLLSKSGKARFTGQPIPQVRVQRRAGSGDATLLDDVLWQHGSGGPAFILLAVSQDGSAPSPSSCNNTFFEKVGGHVFCLALGEANTDQISENATCKCEYTVANDEPLKEFEHAAPFAALLRPDRFVLGCTHLDHADGLLQELEAYLSGHETATSKL